MNNASPFIGLVQESKSEMEKEGAQPADGFV